MSKYPPPPWSVNPDYNQFGEYANCYVIQTTPMLPMQPKEEGGEHEPHVREMMDEICRLIESAPEMLPVLVAARASISDALGPDPSADWRDSLSDALDAIDATIGDAAKEKPAPRERLAAVVRCSECLGTNVQCHDWIDPNAETVVGNFDSTWESMARYGQSYCNDCGEHTVFEAVPEEEEA